MGMYLFAAWMTGMLVPLQTAANARMRRSVGAALPVTLLSFAVSSLLLAVVSLARGMALVPTAAQMDAVPWWGWTGGIIALLTITVTMVLFRVLGPVQTTILPLLGQILFSLVIDHFGLFGSVNIPISPLRAGAMVLLTGGVILVTVVPSLGKGKEDGSGRGRYTLLWQSAGIGAGCLMASIGAMYGRLGLLLGSAVQASAVSFLTATAVMALVCIGNGSMGSVARAFSRGNPWWMWLGGVCGALSVFSNAWLIPRTGAGGFFMAFLLGQMGVSLLMEGRGWMGAERRRISAVQWIGLALMAAGVLFIRWQ